MEKIITTDDICKRIVSKIKPQWKAAFFGGVIIGLLTYMYFMTSNFLNYDSMWNIYSDQDMITSGRQFLTYACGISSFYNLPWINGILAIFFLAITSVVVVEGLGIESKTGAVLAAGFLVTFPAVSSTFCYIFTVDGYMVAVLLAALAFLAADRRKFGFVPGMFLLGISMGIYQAYLSFTIVLCILRLLRDLIEQDKLKTVWDKIWRYAAMGIGAYAFYVITLKIMLRIKNTELSGYQGTDRVGSFALGELPAGLRSAWDNFINFARWSNVLTTTEIMKYCFVLLAAGAAILYLYLFIQNKRYQSVMRILLVVLLLAAIPFGATIVNILSPGTYFHLLMRLPWALFFVFAVMLTEMMKYEGGKLYAMSKRIASVTICLCAVIMIFSFSVMANIVAFNMNERYEKTYATCLRIVDRIEQTEGYEVGTKVAILGGFPSEEYYPSTDITTDDLVGYFGCAGDLCVNSTEKYAVFFSHYLGVTITTISAEEEIRLTETEQYMAMPKFPSEGSVDFIEDVLVIKLNG